MSLQQDWLDEIAKKIQKRLDFDILVSVIYDKWTLVKLPGYTSIQQEKDVQEWLKKHFKKGTYNYNETTFVFKYRKNAEWFILRWL